MTRRFRPPCVDERRRGFRFPSAASVSFSVSRTSRGITEGASIVLHAIGGGSWSIAAPSLLRHVRTDVWLVENGVEECCSHCGADGAAASSIDGEVGRSRLHRCRPASRPSPSQADERRYRYVAANLRRPHRDLLLSLSRADGFDRLLVDLRCPPLASLARDGSFFPYIFCLLVLFKNETGS